MRLIDADELLNRLPDELPYKASVRRVLMQAQDAAVHCKDCRFKSIERGMRYCSVWERFNGAGDDGFCNYGEREGGNA